MRILGSLSWTCNSRRFNFLNGLISLDDTMKWSATFALLYSWVNQKLHGIPVLNLSQKPFNYSTEPSLSLLYRRLLPLPLFILDPFTCWNSIEAILDSTHTHTHHPLFDCGWCRYGRWDLRTGFCLGCLRAASAVGVFSSSAFFSFSFL